MFIRNDLVVASVALANARNLSPRILEFFFYFPSSLILSPLSSATSVFWLGLASFLKCHSIPWGWWAQYTRGSHLWVSWPQLEGMIFISSFEERIRRRKLSLSENFEVVPIWCCNAHGQNASQFLALSGFFINLAASCSVETQFSRGQHLASNWEVPSISLSVLSLTRPSLTKFKLHLVF